MALSVASSALNGLLAWLMLRASRQHGSIALEADARHLLTDVWTSAGVVVGLLLAGATGWLWLDPLVAIGVALNIVREGAHLIWRSSQGLMDAAAEPDVQTQIDAVLARFAPPDGADVAASPPAAAAGPAVRIDHVLSRRAGQRHFLSLHMHLPADWPLGRAAALRAEVEQALLQAVPGLQVSIQLLPLGVEPLSELGELGEPAESGGAHEGAATATAAPMALGHAHRH